MTHDDVLDQIAALPPSSQRDAYIEFVSSGGDATLRRDGGSEHVTASCFVFSPGLESTLLCFHRKGNFWVQFGGHIEPEDGSVADAAVREAREESGIHDLELLTKSIVDLDRHALNGGFSCATHWDVGFVAIADPHATITVSDESEDVRWFPLHDLPPNAPNDLDTRLDRARKAIIAL